MNTLLDKHRATLSLSSPVSASDPRLVLSTQGKMTTSYAPFEYVNRSAKLVLVGITPGIFQAQQALNALQSCLHAGMSDHDSLRRAKEAASFSGSMRKPLVKMLDSVGVHEAIGLSSCMELFDERADLVHYTSALRNPVFVDGRNYTGSPAILRTPYLRTMAEEWLAEEVAALPSALWIAVGKAPTAVLEDFAKRGLIASDRFLGAIPHPSGSNRERIGYFLGKTSKNGLSATTNAGMIDAARKSLITKLLAA